MHHITEDTPPDMLAGAMDLSVRLPDGKDVNMSVERSTPMMDLLVQVTTAYKLRPSDHIVQALDMSDRERALPFKPNVPIGALDTQRIRVLPKGKPPAPRAPPPPGHQPFESTFRLQVHLPRNQFCVIRVGKHVLLENIMRKVCEEKNLDPRKYEFRHPANIDKVLDPKRTLNDYEITEITVVHRGSAHLSQTISSSDIMALQREEERRKMQAKTGGGVLNLIFRRGRSSMGSGSVSSDTRSISPTQSDDSRSVTPPAVQPPQLVPSVPQEPKQPPNRPKPPQRKRRPAPKPPTQPQSQLLQQQQQQSQPQQLPDLQPQENEAAEVVQELEQCQPDSDVTTNLENGLTICHSRNSSDSSGYHEASILSDNCNTTLPRRPKATVINASLTSSTLSVDHSTEFRKSTGNLSNMIAHSKSTTSLTTAGRKKKAPPPPPVPKSSSVANMATETSSAPVVASVPLTEPLQKSSPADNPTPAIMTESIECLPKPKPRMVKPSAPVPTPRKVLTGEMNHQNHSQDYQPSPVTNITLDTSSSNRHLSIEKEEDISAKHQSSGTHGIYHSSFENERIKQIQSFRNDEISPRNGQSVQIQSSRSDGIPYVSKEEQSGELESSRSDEISHLSMEERLKQLQSSRSNSSKEEQPTQLRSFINDGTHRPSEEELSTHFQSSRNDKRSEKEQLSFSRIIKTSSTSEEERPSQLKSSRSAVCIHPPEEDHPPQLKTSRSDGMLRKNSKFDTIGRKRGFQIGKSMFSIDCSEGNRSSPRPSVLSTSGSETPLNSPMFSHNNTEENFNLEIENIEMFTSKRLPGKSKKKISKHSAEIHEIERNRTFDEAMMMKSLDPSGTLMNDSSLSLRSLSPLPAFLGSSGIKKWDNFQDLGEMSNDFEGRSLKSSAWVIGDTSDAESTYPATQSDIVSDLSLHHPLSPASNFDSPTPPSSPSSGDPSPRISNSSASPITSLPEKTPLNHRTIQEKNPSTALDQNQNCTSDQNQNCTLEDLPDVHKLTVTTTEPSPKTLENFNPSGLKSQEVSKKMAPPQPNYTKDTKEIRSSYESAFHKEGDERTGNGQGPKRHSPEGPNLLTPSGRSQESPEEPLEPLEKSTLEASPGKSALDRKSGQVDPSALQPDPRLSSVDLNQRDLSMKSEPTLNQLKKSGQILRPTDPSAKPDPTLNPVGLNLSMESEPKPNQVDLSPKADSKFLPNSLDLSGKPDPEDPIDLDTDWQYTLPSPPTAFRDSSPTNFTDLTNYDTVTFNGLTATDSVVTSPALFEKLESIKGQSETGTVASETGSSSSDRILTSKYLSLETLEKRKSLVLERELSSLKVVPNSEELKLKKESLRNEMEEMFQSKKGGGLSRTNSQSREKILMGSDRDSTLPNFKITTYDQPKGKINIFEDDSIRSNVDPSRSADSSKRNSTLDLSTSKANHSEDFPLAKSDFPNPSKRRSTIDISASKSTSSEEDFQIQKRSSLISSSSENVSSYFPKRNSVDDFIFKKPQEVPKFRNLANEEKNGDVVSRSESFSSQKNVWSRSNPVKRSKSHISLDRYKEHNKFAADEPDDGLHKSNSLFNVSGLQSLEVMRMILPKLGNTPPSTPPEDLKSEPLKPPQAKPEQQPASPKPEVPEKEAVTKKYQYSGPPAINLGTWSDRPKSQISLKEDQDYKISNIAAMKSRFNSQTNLSSVSEVRKPEIKPEIRPQPESLSQNFPSVNIRVNGVETSRDQPDSGKINIKINSDPSNSPKIQHQSSGNNVIIKIGSPVETPQKPEGKLRENSFYSRFLNQTTATAYRKPLGNINGVDKPRPHSIAFDSSCPDLSRVPIVRAVELKKPYKDPQNKSITQIVPDGPPAESPVEAPRRGQNRGQGQPHAKSSTLGAQYRHSSVYLSSENLSSPKTEQQNKILSLFSKPVSRVSSFAARTTNAPVVKGFRVPTSRDNDLEGANGPRGHASSKSAPFLPGSSSNLVGNSINFVGHSMNYNATNPAGCAPSPSADNSPTRSVSNPRSVAAISANFAQNSGNLTSATLSSNSGGFTLASRGPASISQNSPAVNSSSVAANAAMFETVTLRKTTNGQPFFRHSMGPIGPTIEPSPPPAPQMPKITAVTKKTLQRQRQVEDPRDQLLESIRNFGGKSGLRAVK